MSPPSKPGIHPKFVATPDTQHPSNNLPTADTQHQSKKRRSPQSPTSILKLSRPPTHNIHPTISRPPAPNISPKMAQPHTPNIHTKIWRPATPNINPRNGAIPDAQHPCLNCRDTRRATLIPNLQRPRRPTLIQKWPRPHPIVFMNLKFLDFCVLAACSDRGVLLAPGRGSQISTGKYLADYVVRGTLRAQRK